MLARRVRDSKTKGAIANDREDGRGWLEEDEENCSSQQEADRKRRPTLHGSMRLHGTGKCLPTTE